VWKTRWVVQRCPRCGKAWMFLHPTMEVLCDCYLYCPICGRRMEPYTPPADPREIRKGDLHTLLVCRHHTPPYRSGVRPVEVRLT